MRASACAASESGERPVSQYKSHHGRRAWAQQAASTILDLTGPEPRILRAGPVSAAGIAEVLGLDAASLSG